MTRYEPTVIQTPTGKWIVVGTVPMQFVAAIFETREDAEAALATGLLPVPTPTDVWQRRTP